MDNEHGVPPKPRTGVGWACLLGTLPLALAGCAPVVATYPHCPVPVLISKVNRARVKTPVPTRKAGTEDVLRASSGIRIVVASSSSRSGGVTTTTTTSSRSSSGPMNLTLEALALSPNKADVDAAEIALDGVWTGDFLFIFPGAMWFELWADPKGRKVLVK
jgi:hypothetical protein